MTSSDNTRSFEDVRDEVTGETFEVFGQTFSVCDVCEEPIVGDVDRCNDCEGVKHTTGTIDSYSFSLRVDGDAPDALVADIEARLAECKAERENDE